MKLRWKIKQLLRRKRRQCYVCGAADPTWEWPFEDGGTILMCDWDNSMAQMEYRGLVGAGRRIGGES